MRRSEFYAWQRRECETGYFIGSRLNGDEPTVSLVGIHFDFGREVPSEEQLELVKFIRPHFDSAWSMTKLRRKAKEASTFADLIGETLPWGMVGLDRRGRCVSMNARAERMLHPGTGLTLTPEGYLSAASATADRALRAAIGRALPDAMEFAFAGVTIPMPRPNGAPDFALRVLPGVSRAGDFDPDYPTVLVLISDPGEPVAIDHEQLRDMFALTRRECELACLLASGTPLPEIPRTMGIALNTVRVHLQNIFAKTDTHTQADLVRKVRSLFPITRRRGDRLDA